MGVGQKKNKLIRQAVLHLKKGGVVVYPTETSYGFGVDATDEKAVDRVFALKRRAPGKTLPLIVGSLAAAERVAIFSPLEHRLARCFWPGPLTILLMPQPGIKLSRRVVAKGRIALRVSPHPLARRLANGLGRPLVSTSANLSGQSPGGSIQLLRKQFGKKLSTDLLIFDAGVLSPSPPSTIVRVWNKKIQILRPGVIPLSVLNQPDDLGRN